MSSFGYSLTAFERGRFLELLYRNLPEADTKVKTSKRVSEIATHASGVVVSFDDGSSEEGSIVIGADGVWSTVRRRIAELAPPGAVDEKFWKADYLCAYGRGDYIKGIPAGAMIERDDDGWAFQGANHTDQFIWLLSKRVPESQAKSTYSREDEEVFWADILDEKLYEDVTGRDIWSTRTETGLTMLYQGTAKSWYWDRVVMVGDANHKVRKPSLSATLVLPAETYSQRRMWGRELSVARNPW